MSVNVVGELNAAVHSDGNSSFERAVVGSDGTSIEDSVSLADGKVLYSKVVCR